MNQSLSEEFQNHLNNRPDECMLAWWRSELEDLKRVYRGNTHAINCVLARNEDVLAQANSMIERYKTLESELAKTQAAFGAIQAENVALKERMDKMSEWAKGLKTNGSQDS